MIGTDKYSYASRLKTVDPTAKLTLSAISVVLCLCTDSVLVSLLAVAVCCALSARKGGTSPGVFLRLMRTPLGFLLMGMVTVALARFPDFSEVLWGVKLSGWVYGVSAASLWQGVHLVLRALGCIASIYFTVLSTPMTDLLLALRRLHVPRLFLELMELIYRFIFVLYETAGRIHTAQNARLGYQGLRRSYGSLGMLLSMVFWKAYRKSDRIYTSLEARGYEGELRTLPQPYESGRAVYLWCAGLSALQMAGNFAERRLLPF